MDDDADSTAQEREGEYTNKLGILLILYGIFYIGSVIVLPSVRLLSGRGGERASMLAWGRRVS